MSVAKIAPPPRRRHLRQLAGGLTLAAGGSIGLIRDLLAQGNHPVAPGIQSLKGEVLIDGRPAVLGEAVPAGATVVTRRGAEAIYVIGDNAFLQRENSTVRFGGEAAKEFLRVLSGKLLSVFGKGRKTLHTPTATIGIRGTGCYIEASPAEVYFCLCYGAAEVLPNADPSRPEQLVTYHHDRPLLIRQDPRMPVTASAPVINHSDAELTLLENLTGRWPPFYGSGNTY